MVEITAATKGVSNAGACHEVAAIPTAMGNNESTAQTFGMA